MYQNIFTYQINLNYYIKYTVIVKFNLVIKNYIHKNQIPVINVAQNFIISEILHEIINISKCRISSPLLLQKYESKQIFKKHQLKTT